jgi:hypothetical protein
MLSAAVRPITAGLHLSPREDAKVCPNDATNGAETLDCPDGGTGARAPVFLSLDPFKNDAGGVA